MTPEVRLSPDGRLIAVRTDKAWLVDFANTGDWIDPQQVSDWTPLLPASIEDDAA